MTSKIQQAKNEKLLKELARLSENKRCAICTCMGTQYTCQPPSIFVCSTCAGAIYRFPGFRVKSRSMATYTTAEVQLMKEGGNAAFLRCYLAKWNANTFPAPTDKNPKKVEEFIRQVLVDKVFYSEAPQENKPAEEVKTTVIPIRSILQKQQSARSMNADDSWKAFADDSKATNARHSGGMDGAASGGNWAEFPAAPAVKSQTQPFDPFAPGSPIHASPKSVHSTPADPFAAHQQAPVWEAFPESAKETVQPPQQVQTGWSQFETHPVDTASMGRSGSLERAAEAQTPANGTARSKPVMDPLPEEWFSVGTSPSPPPTTGPTATFVPPDPPVYQAALQPPFPGSSAFGNAYPPPAFQPTVQPSYGFNSQVARASLGTFSSFQSTAAALQWQLQPQVQPQPQLQPQPQGFPSMQKQDSMASYVSHRVDETSHNPLFQNLDMDMRAKAHSVTGVPIQTTSHTLFQNSAVGNTSLSRPGNTPPFQQPFMQTSPQTGFDETGNPFA